MRIIILLAMLAPVLTTFAISDNKSSISHSENYKKMVGFIDMSWDSAKGRLLLHIKDLNQPFLYQSSLARGIGSNDLGLDRGQLGSTKIVEFQRSGPKVLLFEHNLDYRALSDDADEKSTVQQSFAQSVIWGFDILEEKDGALIVDATKFFLRDAHAISTTLSSQNEGSFQPDPSRSAIYLPRTKSFPDNSEVESILTFTGQATGQYLPTVTPDLTSFTVHLHHSMIRLPDDGYTPIPYDSRTGLIGAKFKNFATPIGEPLTMAYARRFRLQKKDPHATISEAVKPIVYYVDRGAPEPIRSALIEGASWWNDAFSAVGYKNAFQVKLLPEGADPMDVRYNIIQWVHRSTRGWSYGGGIVDPRTGEILKGHVTLGSLRVRQDYLIAEGLLAPYAGDEIPDQMLAMALARIRQLSAHEVGHTLGIQHNFAASTQNRASVMDYPFPLIRFNNKGELDLSDAYGNGIGEWDKRVILYGYQDFPDGVDAQKAREDIIATTIESGLRYVSDKDARHAGTAHPDGNLWDNGADATAELEHLLRVREYALSRFSEKNIRRNRPMATIEEVLVPIYLLHRFQIRAVGKLIGGFDFNYTLRGDGQSVINPIAATRQEAAINALVNTLKPAVLRLPEHLLDMIPPRPPGHPDSRETFPGNTGVTFDSIGAAESAVALVLEVLLEPDRAARMIDSSSRQANLPGFGKLTESLVAATWRANRLSGRDGELQRATNNQVLDRMMLLAVNEKASGQVRAIALDTINGLDLWLAEQSKVDSKWRAHYGYAKFRIAQMRNNPQFLEQITPVSPPPGEPVGDAPIFQFVDND